jgi:hypothetical protein
LSARPERTVAVRLKTGAHAGEIRPMERDTAVELEPLGRVEIVPWEEYETLLRERRLLLLGVREQPPENQNREPGKRGALEKLVAKNRRDLRPTKR